MWIPIASAAVGALAFWVGKALYSWLKNPKAQDTIDPPTIPPAAVR